MSFVRLMLAQQPAAPVGDAGQFLLQWGPVILIGVMFYFMMYLPQKRERQTREEMLKNLKKNDRVVTIGGMLGTVANISADGKEVTLKVEETAKIRMLRSAIQAVLSPDAETTGPAT